MTHLLAPDARQIADAQELVRWGKAKPGEELVIGYRLRQLREEAGLTQRELAERLGITQQAVSLTEPWTANPRWSQVLRWCEACDAELALDLKR